MIVHGEFLHPDLFNYGRSLFFWFWEILFRLGEEGEETFYRTYAEVCDRFDAMELSSDSKGTLCLRYVRHYPFDNTFYKQTHYVLLYCYKVCIFLLWSII
ncbi:hypothetical protein Bca4012_015539 [Brassica carinata]|uniref:Uncharacterized protein n=1 Tax=Brassica carinata TaxID=52824 RepID=A0A8X7TKI0_BRACI|nr:hypothetical protein Bca52824_093696 [Brassica carinata]